MRYSNGLFRLFDISRAGGGPSRKFGEGIIEPRQVAIGCSIRMVWTG